MHIICVSDVWVCVSVCEWCVCVCEWCVCDVWVMCECVWVCVCVCVWCVSDVCVCVCDVCVMCEWCVSDVWVTHITDEWVLTLHLYMCTPIHVFTLGNSTNTKRRTFTRGVVKSQGSILTYFDRDLWDKKSPVSTGLCRKDSIVKKALLGSFWKRALFWQGFFTERARNT